MATTVVSVRGKAPEEWLADPSHVYVGRRVFLRSGKFAGQLWRPSLYMNPHSLPPAASRQQQLLCLQSFLKYLAEPRQEGILRSLRLLRNKELGCWCGAWSHHQPTKLLCHAVVLAVLADHWQPGQTMREALGHWMSLDL